MNPTTNSTRRHRWMAAVVAAGLLTLTTACGEDRASSEAEPSTSTSSVVHETPTTGVGHDNHVEVNAVDFAFEGLPATIEAGTRLSLRNAAAHELHELVAFRLPDGETRTVSDLLKLPASELGSVIGQPATVLLAPPGQEQIPAVGDGTLTEPGRYLVMCSIPTGVEPAAYLKAAAEAGGKQPQVAGGPPHFTAGMLAELTVR